MTDEKKKHYNIGLRSSLSNKNKLSQKRYSSDYNDLCDARRKIVDDYFNSL